MDGKSVVRSDKIFEPGFNARNKSRVRKMLTPKAQALMMLIMMFAKDARLLPRCGVPTPKSQY